MPAHEKKPQLEVPEEGLVEHFVDETETEDDEQLTLPQTKPDTVNEADWADQQVDVPLDDDEEHS